MTGRPAARFADLTSHGIPALSGPGALTVLICNQPAWRAMVDICTCPLPIAPPAPAPHGPEICYMGSTTVLINNQMACRVADILQAGGPPNPFAMGCFNVLIGDIGFGMASQSNMDAYALAMRDIFDNWDSMTSEERLTAMEVALMASLPPGMPPLIMDPADLPAATNGQLDFQNWAVQINRDMLNGPMSEERFAALTNTIYHEGRHGEQWFNVAQYRAGQGGEADDIASDMAIPQHVAEAAHDNPVAEGTSEGAMGETVDSSVYGDRSDHREEVLGDSGTYEDYRALPEEQDAFGTGDAAGDAFNGTAP